MTKKKEDAIITTTVRLSKKKHLALKKYCLNHDLTMTDFFNKCIDEALNQKKKEGN